MKGGEFYTKLDIGQKIGMSQDVQNVCDRGYGGMLTRGILYTLCRKSNYYTNPDE